MNRMFAGAQPLSPCQVEFCQRLYIWSELPARLWVAKTARSGWRQMRSIPSLHVLDDCDEVRASLDARLELLLGKWKRWWWGRGTCDNKECVVFCQVLLSSRLNKPSGSSLLHHLTCVILPHVAGLQIEVRRPKFE